MSNERTGVLELTLGDSYIGSAYSPQVEVTDTETGHEVAIAYMSPEGIVTERFDVADGEQGPQGPAGFSPTVTITDTPTGHTVTITDEDGPHSYDVPNYAREEAARQTAWNTLSGEVTDAISDAETATSAASTAATSATSAATSATTAAQAATTAAASASTAASSANAAATAANTAANAASTAADAATTAAGDATDAASAANTAAQAAQEAATELAPEVAWLWGNQLTSELTGDLLTAADAYAAPPMALVVDGRSTQDGTPTPDAPVPIESVDELALAFAGKNLFDYPTEPWTNTSASNYNGYTLSGGFRSIPDGVTTITASMYIDNSSASDTSVLSVWAHNSNGVVVPLGSSSAIAAGSIGRVSKTYEVSNYNDFALGGLFRPGTTVSQLMAEIGSTLSDYEPYQGHTVPIPLQDHVLRSLPDDTKDTLALTYLRPSTREGWAWYSRELTQAIDIVTLDGTQNWFLSASGTYTRFGTSLVLTSACVPIADKLAYYSIADLLTHPYGINAQSNNRIYVSLDETITTEAQAKAWFVDNNTVVQCKLAAPITYDLGEIELPVLPAPNATVWADPTTGLQMEYVRDSNLVVQSLSAETAIAYASIATVDGPTATAGHATGTYLTMGGTLYKVTQAIAVGETIAAGTNVTATTVMAELIARTA